MEYRVTITLNSSYAFRKALAITRNSPTLDSAVEVKIRDWGRRVFKIKHLFSPTLYTLFKNIPAMRQLQTIHVANIFLARTYLHCILSSPHLTHLILDTIEMPKIGMFPPPPKLRKLTIIATHSWEALEPLITQLATLLECLELQRCEFRLQRQLQLPPFPCLRELCHERYYSPFDNDNRTVLNGLFTPRLKLPACTYLDRFTTAAPLVPSQRASSTFHPKNGC